MRSHLDDDVLLDVIEGAASVEAVRHAGDCAECGRRVAEAREGLALAVGAEAPEPSPLYWAAFRRRVAAGLDADRQPARRFGGFLAPALFATAATVAVLSFIPRDSATRVASPAPVGVASALPVGEDPAVEAVAGSIDDLGCRDVDACVAGLSDEESRALADALRADLAGSDL